MRKMLLALSTGTALFVAANAQAAGTPISIQSGVNSNLYTYTGGTDYPAAGSTVTVSGANGVVDFTLAHFYANDPNAADTGVVQSGDGAPNAITINTPDVLITGAATFYSLINSSFGRAGNTVGNLTFNFATGPAFVYDLTEGLNLRDHYNGIYNNDVTDVYGTLTYTDDRLDAQEIALPLSYIGDTLLSVTLNNTDPADGNPFIAALTGTGGVQLLAAVPEPASWAMMLGGFGMVGGAMRARRRRVRFA